MHLHSVLKKILVTSVAAGALVAGNAAWAASTRITTPNIDTTAGAVSVTFNGQTFVNHGLQGMGRLPASTKDFNNDTLGAFSGMDIILSSWRRNADGSYGGTLFSLPDRGPNQVGQVGFSDYAGRLSQFAMSFTPYTAVANLPAAASSQNQLTLTQQGGFFLRDFNGNVTTGLDPVTGPNGVVTQNGIQLPGNTTGPAAGKISLDAEGLRFLRDGSFYVSDEYGANAYYFNASGQLQGVIRPPSAIIPRDATGNLIYSSSVDATTGRRLNQGMEGMAVTPDGKRLATLLQSATMQDTNGTNQQTRNNTRLMIYDISGNKTPTNPIAHYVLELPVWQATGNGGAPNRTAAQSDMLALNATQFLVLSRDGNGLGVAQNPLVYKSILLIDTAAATNIAGTNFETTNTPIATNGTLNASITPVRQVQLVNMLNSTQLAKFGENLNNAAPTLLTLGEKWEGLALVPVLEENAPQDYFLFVGNDNDFLSTTCNVGGQNCAQTVDSDSHVLVYRLTLPTYVDPEYLYALNTTGPIALEMMAQSALSVAETNTGNVLAQLNAQRRAGVRDVGFSTWVSGAYRADDWGDFSTAGTSMDRKGFRGTIGLDYAFDANMTAGLSFGYGRQDVDNAAGFNVDTKGYSIGTYLQYRNGGFYASAGMSFGEVDLDRITRPSAYGLTGVGNTDARIISGFVEAGYDFQAGQITYGPVVGYSGEKADIHGYTESGAAGGNLVVPEHTVNSSVLSVGGEISAPWGSVTPYGRLTYNWQLSSKTRDVELRLASAQNAMGTAVVSVPTMNEDYVQATAGLQGTMGQALWNLGYTAQLGTDDRTSHVVRAGIGYRF